MTRLFVRAALASAIIVAVATFVACSSFSGTSGDEPASDASASTGDGQSFVNDASVRPQDAGPPPTFCSLEDARFCDDFERDPADAKGPWTTLMLTGLGSTLVLADEGEDGGRVALAQAAPGSGNAYLSVSLPAVMNSGDVTLDVLFRGISGSTEMAGFELGTNGPYIDRQVFFRQDVQKTGLAEQFVDTSGTESVVFPYGGDSPTPILENVWYRVRVHVDLSEGGISGILYVNSAKIASFSASGEFAEAYAPAAPTVDVGIFNAQGDAAAGLAVLVDNVVVTY